MTNIQIIALVLLAGHLISLGFIIAVVKKQLNLFRTTFVKKNAVSFRRVLFIVTLTILVTNLPPIAIDIAALLIDIGRSEPRLIGIIYSSANVLNLLVSAIGWFIIYKIAEKNDIIAKEFKGE